LISVQNTTLIHLNKYQGISVQNIVLIVWFTKVVV